MLNRQAYRRSQGALHKDAGSSGIFFAGISAVALLSALMLSACGGDSVGEIVDDIVCVYTNCKMSDSLKVDDISPKFTVTQQNGQVKVAARLGQSANLITVVHLSGSDHLSASIGNQRRDLQEEGGKLAKYSVQLADASEQPLVSANFVRGSELHGSTVTMPKPFSVLAPVGVPMIARSSGKFVVQMNQPYSDKMGLNVDMVCKRSDGSGFDSKDEFLPVLAEGGAYRLATLELDAALNRASLAYNTQSPNSSPVQTCELSFRWTLRQTGTVASTLNRHSSIVALREVVQAAAYDARL